MSPDALYGVGPFTMHPHRTLGVVCETSSGEDERRLIVGGHVSAKTSRQTEVRAN